MRQVTFVLLASAMVRAGTPFWAPQHPSKASYVIDARIASDGSRLDGSETIRFRNDTRRPFGRLALTSPGGELSVRVNGAPAKRVEGVSSPALFELAQEIAPGQAVELAAEFTTNRSPLKGGEGGAGSGWYPQLWWGFGTLDDYEVRISASDELTITAGGAFRDGAYRGRNIRAFAIFVGRGYQVAEERSGDVQVRAVFRPKAAESARILLKTAVDAVAFYRERYGFYPHDSLTITQGGDRANGGYPIASAVVAVHGQERMSDREPDWWRWITAHEIGHMYWGDYVLARGSDSLDWLMIGMGIRADQEYRRARGIKAGELWQTYASGVTKGYDTTMDLTDGQERRVKWDFNNVVTHGKSSAMLNALESVIGREDFDSVYRACLHYFAGRQFGWRDLQALAERQTGQDLGWFFEQWVRSPAYTGYRVAAQNCEPSSGAFECTVTVEKTGTMRMPVVFTARLADGSEQRLSTERLANTDTLRFRAKARIATVTADPAVVMPDRPAQEAGDLSDRIDDLPWSGAGDEALQLYQEWKLDRKEPNVAFKLGLLMYDGGHYAEALEAFGLVEQSTEPSLQFAGLVWQGHILDLTGRRGEAVVKYDAALKVPGEQRMQHSQYNMVIDRGWVEERRRTPFRR